MRSSPVIAATILLMCVGCASQRATGVAEMQAQSTDVGWDVYTHADALAEAGRTDEAVGEYRRAQALFGDRNFAGRSIAVYGRARALDRAGRCNEAVATYQEYADLVRRTNPASAQAALSVARDCHQVPSGEAALSQTVNALARGDYSNALALAERVEPSTPDDSGWLEYDRGQALTGLRRTSEALLAFDKAEQLFTAVDDQRGRSDAAWGKARALELAGLCPEADRAYASYERIVGSSDPASAQMAAEHARACSPTIVIH